MSKYKLGDVLASDDRDPSTYVTVCIPQSSFAELRNKMEMAEQAGRRSGAPYHVGITYWNSGTPDVIEIGYDRDSDMPHCLPAKEVRDLLHSVVEYEYGFEGGRKTTKE